MIASSIPRRPARLAESIRISGRKTTATGIKIRLADSMGLSPCPIRGFWMAGVGPLRARAVSGTGLSAQRELPTISELPAAVMQSCHLIWLSLSIFRCPIGFYLCMIVVYVYSTAQWNPTCRFWDMISFGFVYLVMHHRRAKLVCNLCCFMATLTRAASTVTPSRMMNTARSESM